jgi:hypothetical protein
MHAGPAFQVPGIPRARVRVVGPRAMTVFSLPVVVYSSRTIN